MRYLLILLTLSCTYSMALQASNENPSEKRLTEIRLKRNNPKALQSLLPIVKCSIHPSRAESLLMSRLRDKNISKAEFRDLSEKIGALLASKVIECLTTNPIEIETPLVSTSGEALVRPIELVTIMRSGDALLNTFINYFPEANVSKVLIQRDEETALPDFKYMKLSKSLGMNRDVIILEPMIATGGTLEMVIRLLKEKGIAEENIIVASICTAPEGLVLLNDKFPAIRVVLTVLDERLNEHKYIVPGLGDFGDRYF